MSDVARVPRRKPLESVQDESRSLVAGAIVFRWVWLLWMAGLAVMGRHELIRVEIAWASIGAAAAWTLWLTLTRSSWNGAIMAFDVALCGWLILASGLVVKDGDVISGRPFFATGYPLSAPLLWGAWRGPAAGALTAAVLSIAHVLTRPLNGVTLDELSPGQVQNLTGAMLNYFVGGLAVGFVARMLGRSAEAVALANEEALHERELRARLSERETLARAIHDSVLQALALVHKRGKELAASGHIEPSAVAELAATAGRQEEELRALILRTPQDAPSGRSSLRDAVEEIARGVESVEVVVSATGPLWMEAFAVEEITAAVRQTLDNVVEHADATKVNIFIEEDGGESVVSIRDDGAGFDYDEGMLEREGKVGMLKSMKGRIVDLGGSMSVATQPGRGTEIEFRVPVSDG
ncbi:MAG TPA: ATP-binding protein [Actinomycetota bacterium]|nr:ATP-binding protein [Actinomycetota bacterium]